MECFFTLCLCFCVCLLRVHGSVEYSDKYNDSLVPLSSFLLSHLSALPIIAFAPLIQMSAQQYYWEKSFDFTCFPKETQKHSGFHGTISELLHSTVLSLKMLVMYEQLSGTKQQEKQTVRQQNSRKRAGYYYSYNKILMHISIHVCLQWQTTCWLVFISY